MKKTTLLLFVCWLLALGRVAAQSAPPSDSVRLYLDNMFANLDKTQIPTPYLEEYGSRFAPLRLFTGTLQDSNRTTATLWRLLYGTVLSGNINGPCPLPLPPDLNTALRTQSSASPAIPLLVQRIDYATLRPDAVSAGLLTGQNEQLFDVPGRTQSPYRVRTLFAAAPARSTVPTGDVSFIFTQALHVQSGGGSLRSLSLDFGDGRGYLAATWNQSLAASYSTAGTKRVKVRVIYNIPSVVSSSSTKAGSAGTLAVPSSSYATYESHFDLEVLAPAAYPSGAARYATDGFMRPFPPVMGMHSGGMVHVRFGGALGSRTQMTKPLIVAEGYDPSFIAPEVDGNYSIETFLTAISRSNFNTGPSLYDALEDRFSTNGYDIIFIDYNNGTDDIRRNAALFEEVVRWVNSQKVIDPAINAKQRNVVLGISMGGLVARYGLAEMEKRGTDPTDTRLLLTHDSPHRGANTPLGLQALTRQAAGTLAGQYIRVYNSFGPPYFIPKLALFPILQQADDLLDAPATKQLLLVRATRQFVGAFSQFGHQYNSFVDGEYRTMITPNPGQPFPYQFKATSLGSQCGVGLLAPHSELVRVEGEGYMSIFLASTGLHTEVIVNAMPNGGQVERLSGLRVWQQVRVLSFSRKIYLTRFDYQSPASNPIAWDGLPGGTQRINGQINLTPGVSSGSWWQFPLPLFGYTYSVALANSFCFIPTASALDVPIFDNVTTRASYISNATNGPSQPRASSFIAQGPYADPNTGQASYNFEHPRFPGRQGQWLFNEMENNAVGNAQLTCTSECNPFASLVVVGPGEICPNSTVSYSIPSLPAGMQVNWQASPAGILTPVNGPVTPTFMLQSTTTAGQVTLQATIITPAGCQIPVLPLNATVGSTSIGLSISGGCGGQSATFIAGGLNLGTDYRWTLGSPPNYQNPVYQPQYNGASSITITLPSNPSIPAVSIGVSVNSTCAGSGMQQVTQDFGIFHGLGCENARRAPTGPVATPPATATLYPNPAREAVNVHIDGASAASPITVRLFDAYGQLRVEQTSRGAATLRLGTEQLPAGLYFVHLLRGNQVLKREQLRIEK